MERRRFSAKALTERLLEFGGKCAICRMKTGGPGRKWTAQSWIARRGKQYGREDEMTDHEATYAMMALRASVADRKAPAEFTEAMTRQVVEYVDWLREQNATAREALEPLAACAVEPSNHDRTLGRIRSLLTVEDALRARYTLAAMDGDTTDAGER